jgi:hypothetical protein
MLHVKSPTNATSATLWGTEARFRSFGPKRRIFPQCRATASDWERVAELHRVVSEALDGNDGRVEIRYANAFRPAYPRPEHRFNSLV